LYFRRRRFGLASAAFALLSVFHFSALLPNHLVSELRHFLFVADYGSFADFICENPAARRRPAHFVKALPRSSLP
jgi:hypothetical protein